MNYAASRATAATVRFVALIIVLAVITVGAALPLLLLAPVRYRAAYRKFDGGYVPRLVTAAARCQGGVR